MRSRWAAIGAAIAVTLGSGGLFTAWADSPQSVFTAIEPVRVLDTRDDIGLTGAFKEGQTRFLDVTGSIPIVLPGNVAGTDSPVPEGATAIVANVTAVAPTTAGFVSVRPGTATGTPTTSNLNFSPGAVVPNSVTVELPTTGARAGQLNLFFRGTTSTATTDLLIDIVGYYTKGGSGTPGPKGDTGAEGPAGLSFIADFDFTSVTPIGGSSSPPAPAGYLATVDLTAGRYYVTGDLSVQNTDASNAGSVVCRTHVNSVAMEVPSVAGVPPGNFANIAISNTFTLAADGFTAIDFRCYRGGSTSMTYWYANMTIFKVG
jgi:hypothetical protein